MTHQTPTPSFARLLDWTEDKLSADEAARVAIWATQLDKKEREQLAWVQAFMRQSHYTVLVEPSEAARQSVHKKFEDYTREHRKPCIVHRWAAMLTSTSRSRLGLAGVRSGSVTDTGPQLVYSTDLADVILTICARPQDRLFNLSGQVLPLSDALNSTRTPLTVQMVQHDVEYRVVATNTLGEFVFTSMAPGPYALFLSNGQHEIEISTLEI